MSVSNVNPIAVPNVAGTLAQPQRQRGVGDPGTTFTQTLESLSQTEATSDALIQKLAAGEDVDVHQVMIAAEQTDIRFRIAMAMRDRLVEAYREVMRMSV